MNTIRSSFLFKIVSSFRSLFSAVCPRSAPKDAGTRFSSVYPTYLCLPPMFRATSPSTAPRLRPLPTCEVYQSHDRAGWLLGERCCCGEGAQTLEKQIIPPSMLHKIMLVLKMAATMPGCVSFVGNLSPQLRLASLDVLT